MFKILTLWISRSWLGEGRCYSRCPLWITMIHFKPHQIFTKSNTFCQILKEFLFWLLSWYSSALSYTPTTMKATFEMDLAAFDEDNSKWDRLCLGTGVCAPRAHRPRERGGQVQHYCQGLEWCLFMEDGQWDEGPSIKYVRRFSGFLDTLPPLYAFWPGS